jgi:hypothetical protein
MNENATRLRETMRTARMSRREAAAALHVSIHAITAWLLPKPSANHHPCPAWAPELLAYKAAARARNATPGSVLTLGEPMALLLALNGRRGRA